MFLCWLDNKVDSILSIKHMNHKDFYSPKNKTKTRDLVIYEIKMPFLDSVRKLLIEQYFRLKVRLHSTNSLQNAYDKVYNRV